MGGHADGVPAVGFRVGKVLRRGGGVYGVVKAPQPVKGHAQAGFAPAQLLFRAVGHKIRVGGQAPLGKDRRIAHDPVKVKSVHGSMLPYQKQ